METFLQILDLDEDDTHDFSRGMAWAYFHQVDTTFVEMDDALCVLHISPGPYADDGFPSLQRR